MNNKQQNKMRKKAHKHIENDKQSILHFRKPF